MDDAIILKSTSSGKVAEIDEKLPSGTYSSKLSAQEYWKNTFNGKLFFSDSWSVRWQTPSAKY